MKNSNWLVTIAVFTCFLCAPAQAQLPLQNGGFEDRVDPLNYWLVRGNVAVVTTVSGNHVAQLKQEMSGALSVIYQEFALPDQPAFLFFKYKMLHTPPPDPAAVVPPDSFTAFLLDSAGDRLAVPPGEAPSFTDGFLYEDSSGAILYSEDYVTVSPPDNEGYCTVTLDLTDLTGGATARIEFGFANANNGVNSTVFVDGIVDGCIGDKSDGCPDLDIVFIMDSSGSMDEEALTLCNSLSSIIDALEMSLPINVNATILGISETPGGDYACLDDSVLNLYGPDVPGDPDDCPGDLGGPPPPPAEPLKENWAPATASVAVNRAWTSSLRLIIPISDEGPCLGGAGPGPGCDTGDTGAIANAIAQATMPGVNVIVSPIIAYHDDLPICLFCDAVCQGLGNPPGYAQDIASATGGTTFRSSEDSSNLEQHIINIATAACEEECPGGAPLLLRKPSPSTPRLLGPIAIVDRSKNNKEKD